jgi:hypothetical protein
MPKRISKSPRSTDINQAAFLMVQQTTESSNQKPKAKRKVPAEVSRVMRAMGIKGGKIGGKKRLEWTPEQRSQAALKAATARWEKKAKAAIEQPPMHE